MRVRDFSDRLGPFERRAFSIGKERRLAPGVEGVDTLLGFTVEPRVLRVHVDAIGAAVDLRRSDFDQLEEPPVEALLRFSRKIEHGAANAGADVFRDIDSRVHVRLLCIQKEDGRAGTS
jgi:hypothetical protein